MKNKITRNPLLTNILKFISIQLWNTISEYLLQHNWPLNKQRFLNHFSTATWNLRQSTNPNDSGHVKIQRLSSFRFPSPQKTKPNIPQDSSKFLRNDVSEESSERKNSRRNWGKIGDRLVASRGKPRDVTEEKTEFFRCSRCNRRSYPCGFEAWNFTKAEIRQRSWTLGRVCKGGLTRRLRERRTFMRREEENEKKNGRIVAILRYWPSYFKGTEIMKRQRPRCANTDTEGFTDFVLKMSAAVPVFREACCGSLCRLKKRGKVLFAITGLSSLKKAWGHYSFSVNELHFFIFFLAVCSFRETGYDG